MKRHCAIAIAALLLVTCFACENGAPPDPSSPNRDGHPVYPQGCDS